jgi:hypothetical protein
LRKLNAISGYSIGIGVDDWRRKQGDLPGRPEAIRRLVEIGLTAKGNLP